MPPERSALEAAFRELHGQRLHGFALLMALGDTERAAILAGEALSAGSRRAAELRHPERAAAWLRARVTRRTGRGQRPGPHAARAVARLGVDRATLHGIAALDTRMRAALIGRTVERLELRDVATIVDRPWPEVRRMVDRAIARYASARATAQPPASGGPTVDLVHANARRVVE